MKNAILILVFFIICSICSAQKINVYTGVHVNTTMYDRTITNNAVGFGAWLRTSLQTHSVFSPVIEATASAYGGTKELYVTQDDKPINAKSGVITVMAGSMIHISPTFYTGLLAGPAFFNNKTYLSLQPAIGCYITKKKIITASISFTNIFQRDEISRQHFGYLSFGAGVKLF